MSQPNSYPNFSQYRTVSEAAAFLGVSTTTLRNWDRSGKLTPRRHPQNGYRIYLQEDLEAVLRSADRSSEQGDALPLPSAPGPFNEQEHCVLFYDSDEFLVESAAGYINKALSDGDACVLVYTHEHRNAIERKLTAEGVNLSSAIQDGRYLAVDAEEALSKIMVDGSPDRQHLLEAFSADLARLADKNRRVYAAGEMVAILWTNGNREAAFKLEELWDELGKRHLLSLLCAYPMHGFEKQADATPLGRICQVHSRVIPAESYSGIQDTVEQSGAVVLLQHTVQCLKAELARRDQDRAAS